MKSAAPLRAVLLVFAGTSLLRVSPIHAADGTWLGGSGDWGAPGTWSGGMIADGLDATASFTGIDISADQVINLEAARTIGNIIFTDATTASNNLTISGAGILSFDRTTGSPVIDVTQTGRTLAISSQISGTDGLQKNGTGTLNLSGNNNYTGVTAISNGILAISSNNALGATSGNTTIAATGSDTGPRLALSGNINSAENITLTGNSEQNQYNSVINNTSGTNTLSGNITLASPSGGIRIGSSSGELIFSGTITQTGTTRTLLLQAGSGAALTVNNPIANNNGPLTVLYPGAVTLKSTSTAIGATTIAEGGFLKLGVTNAIKTDQNLTIGSPWNFTGSDQGKFDLAGFNQTVNALVGIRNTTAGTIGADSTRIVTNSATGTSILTVGNGNGAGTFNGVIQDGGSGKIVALTKVGTGTQTLVGNSNYSGVTTISGGAIAITHANALGSMAGNTTIAATGATNGPRLLISGTINSPENITLTGMTETGAYEGAIINTANTNTLSGNITLAGTGGLKIKASGGTLNLTGNITQTGTSHQLVLQPIVTTAVINVSNPISNNGGQLLLVGLNSGAGALVTLGGASGSGIGATVLGQQVTLRLGVTDALNTAANLTISYGGTTTGEDRATLDLRGFNQTVNALVGNVGTGASPSSDASRLVTNGAASTTSILTVGNGGSSGNFRGVIQNGSGTVALTKTGAGTQTLSGLNTYTGATTVNAGTLAVNGSLANTATTVASTTSARLQGPGLIVGPVTIGDKGTLAPGNSIESLGTGAVTFDDNSTLDFEFQTDLFAGTPNASADLVYSTGALSIAPGALLTLTELGTSTPLAPGSKLTLVSYIGGTPPGLFTLGGSPLTDGGIRTIGANTWQFNYVDTSGGPNFAADQSGAGKFFTMTVVPEAGTSGLLALGLLLVRLLRRGAIRTSTCSGVARRRHPPRLRNLR
jgi:fibronectin-binding autotransporter adhesin